MSKRIIFILSFILSNSLFAETKLVANDGSTNDKYGQSVFINDDWLFVGANEDAENNINSGSVYIYSLDENNNINYFSKIIPEDFTYNQFFGKSISSDNNWLAVSAMYDGSNGIKSGAVYIYYYNGDNWIQYDKIYAYDGEQYDRYGYSVSIEENLLIVGSIYDDDMGHNSGSGYLYELIEGVWTLKHKICPEYLMENDLFGSSVDIEGNNVIISAVQDDDNCTDCGSVSIFTINNNDYETLVIYPEDQSIYDYFGYSVSMSGELLAISSYYDDDNGFNSGSVYIYSYFNEFVSFDQKIIASDGAVNDKFGISLSIYNNWLAVGSVDDDNGINSGSLYLYENTIDGFIERAKISPSDGEEFDEFSGSLNIYNNFLVAGSKLDDDQGSDSGSAYVFEYTGCLDQTACNYNQNVLLANQDLCIYSEYGYECNGECFDIIDICDVCGGSGSSGDVNFDLLVNISDVIIIIGHILNHDNINICIADLNYDSSINITDIIYIIDLILYN